MKSRGIGVLSFLVILISSSYFWKQRAYESSEGLNVWGIDREMTPQAFISCLAFLVTTGPVSFYGSPRLYPIPSTFGEEPWIMNSLTICGNNQKQIDALWLFFNLNIA
jgi:hypothetical protein